MIKSTGTSEQLRTTGLIAVTILVAVVLVYNLILFGSKLNWQYIGEHFHDSILIDGAKMTIFLSVIAQVAGILLGLIAALMKVSNSPVAFVNRTLSGIANAYIWLFRGTPLLVQLTIFATGLYTIGIKLDLLTSALLALSLNEGAYMAEIVRAGIQSVDTGQMEAAKSLGMTYGQGMRRIVLPQAARVIIPPTGNEFNNMLKSTSLAQTIGIPELLARAQDLNHFYFRNIETFLIISGYYLIMTSLVTWGQTWIESRLGERKATQGQGFLKRLRNNIFSSGRLLSGH